LLLQVASKRYYCGLYGRPSQQGNRKGRSLDKSGYLPPRQRAYYISLQRFKDNYPLLLFYLIYELEERLRRNDGVYRRHVNRGVAQRDNRGEILLWVGICTDIDEQKGTEQTLKAREEYFRALAETVPQLVWMTRPDGNTEYMNQRWYDYTNTTPEQLLGTGWLQFLHPDDYERTLAARRHALETGEHYEIEYRLRNG
jgi:PAS domain-containing protein